MVVSTPLKNMKVSWDDYSQYMEKYNSCSKPPTRCWITRGLSSMISPTWAQRKGPANVQAHPGDAQAPARGTMEVWGVDPLKMDQFKGKTAGNNHIVFPMKYGVFLWIYIYIYVFFPTVWGHVETSDTDFGWVSTFSQWRKRVEWPGFAQPFWVTLSGWMMPRYHGEKIIN